MNNSVTASVLDKSTAEISLKVLSVSVKLAVCIPKCSANITPVFFALIKVGNNATPLWPITLLKSPKIFQKA